MKMIKKIVICLLGILVYGQAFADFKEEDATKLKSKAAGALAHFRSEVTYANAVLSKAKGLLICPEITKGGLVIGYEGGHCVLQVDGKTTDYYAMHAGKFGLIAGIEWYSLLVAFNNEKALNKFRSGKGEYEFGVDASVAVAKVGAGGSLDITNHEESTVAFTFGEKGFMGDLSLEGSTFKKLKVDNK